MVFFIISTFDIYSYINICKMVSTVGIFMKSSDKRFALGGPG